MTAPAQPGDDTLVLHGYWRSSAAWRVRVGLNLKRLPYVEQPVHLLRDGGEQHAPAHAARNPQQLVPVLRHGGRVLTQSLAILEYLDEMFPSDGNLLPHDAPGRARVRALAQLVACDIHPLNNLRVMQYLERTWEIDADGRGDWMRHWMAAGLAALEAHLADAATGRFCHGDTPGLADCCLVPQLYNARRFELELGTYPTLLRIEQTCLALQAFADAHPDRQPDAGL